MDVSDVLLAVRDLHCRWCYLFCSNPHFVAELQTAQLSQIREDVDCDFRDLHGNVDVSLPSETEPGISSLFQGYLHMDTYQISSTLSQHRHPMVRMDTV